MRSYSMMASHLAGALILMVGTLAMADDTCTVSGTITVTGGSLNGKQLYCNDPIDSHGATSAFSGAGPTYNYTCNGVHTGAVTLEIDQQSAGSCSTPCSNPPGFVDCDATIDFSGPGGCKNPSVTVSLLPLLPIGLRLRRRLEPGVPGRARRV